jgi:hypothetical protein
MITKVIDGKRIPLTPQEIAEWEAEQPDALTHWRATHAMPVDEFCIACHGAGLLSEADAELAATGGWPAAFDAFIAALPFADRVRARRKWAGTKHVRRNDPLLAQIAAAAKVTPEQLDALMGWAE